MKLGAFSISLAVKDLAASKDFYEKVGFETYAGDQEKNYLIMKNGDAVIGLFQGMFENNIITLNPGWDQSGSKVDDFDDVRMIQKHAKEQGLQVINEADENSTGPANFVLVDPDGNAILIDQHV
ncbi:MAG: VOC family protein [Bacteroidota bacterium]